MKLPITDQFLLSLYDFIEKTDKASGFFIPPRTMKEILYPDFRKLRWKYERKQVKRTFSQFIYYLKKKNYIQIKNLKKKQGILLTKNGLEKIKNLKFKTGEIKKRNDGKWQMIIFDIPENKKGLRNLLRKKLYFLGYKMLQQSVWVSPYDVSEETDIFLREYSLDQYIRIFLIEEIN